MKTSSSCLIVRRSSRALFAVAVLMLSQTLTAQTWNLQTSNTMRNLWDVYFLDNNAGFVCGDSGTILKTTDGGANWTSVNSGTSHRLYYLFFVNSNVGFTSGWFDTTGTLLKTTDAGNHWSDFSLGIPNIRSGAILFTSADTGFYAYGDTNFSHSRIMKTTNGGSTWNNVHSGSGWLSFFYFVDADNGFATVSGSTILRTTNGGNTWDSLNVGGNLWMSGIHFFNKDTGIVGGGIFRAAGSLFKTTDGGNTWQNLTNQFGASRIIFPTSTTGYAVGSDSSTWNGNDSANTNNQRIIKTTDGGNNWSFELTPKGNLSSIFFPSTNIGFAVGDSGTILKYSGTLPTGPPAAPQNLAVTDSSSGTITIKWRKNVESDFLRYRIYRSTTPAPTTKVDSTTAGISDTSKTFTGLTNGTRHYFRVTAVDSAANESGYSNEVNASPIGPPTITSFSPASGPIGTTVTITGINFNSIFAYNIVYFGAVRATVTGGSTTSLTVYVPYGTTYAPISVTDTTIGLTAYSGAAFVVTFPGSRVIDPTSFAPRVDFTTGTGTSPGAIALGDIDGDGKPDLAFTNLNTNTVSIFRNTSTSGSITTGSFATGVDFTTGTNPFPVALGDFDGDGKPDLALTNVNSSTVSVFRNTSTSGSITTGSFAARVDFTIGAYSRGIAIGDLDGDGKPDLATANSNSNTVSILRNTNASGSITTGSFAAKVDLTTGTLPWHVTIGDVDGDGKPDLVVTNHNSNTVSVFRNISTSGSITTGSFATKVDFTTGTNPRGVTLGDIDGDGKPDLIVVNFGSDTVSVFRNTSAPGSITTSSFAAKVGFATGAQPWASAINDIDGDGKPDLAVVNSGTSNISVFRNTSTPGSITTGSFAAKVDFTTGLQPWSLALGDIDGDGRLDLAVPNINSNTVSVLRNSIPSIAAPQNLTVSDSSSGQITIRWNKNSELTTLRYRIYRSTSPGATTQVDSTSSALDTTKTFSGLVNGTRYYFRVTAVDSALNQSAYSNEVNAAPADRVAPSAPISLIVTDSSSTTITIKWRKNTEADFLRYRIYRGTTPAPTSKVDSTTAGRTDTSKTLAGLTNGTRYYFRVTAVDSAGNESGYSNEVNAVPNDRIAPAAPQNLVVTDSSSTRIGIKWRKSTAADLLRYRIYRGTTPAPATKVDSTTGGISDTSKTFTGLVNGTRYYLRVTAVDSSGNESAYSNEVNGAPSASTASPNPIPNPGFESWTGASPDGWVSLFDALLGVTTIAQTSDMHSGSWALKGFVAQGNIPPIVASAGFPVSTRYTTLQGYYKFTSVSGDSINVVVALTKSGQSIGAGVFASKTSVVTYTQFSVPITYSSAATPDSAQIIVMISNKDSVRIGTTFFMDDLLFGPTTSVKSELVEMPSSFALFQNYPNPFNPSTVIRYGLPARSHVKLEIYNILGQRVALLADEEQNASFYEVNWQANVPSGIYFYRMVATTVNDPSKSFVQVRKMLMLK